MPPSDPLFSVVIPAYNRSAVIGRTLGSLLKQTDPDFEAIVVDDGSQDSAALKRVIKDLNDPRFIYMWRENGGAGAARNTGTLAARGRFIAFLDSDDTFVPRKLEIMRSFVEDNEKLGFYAPTYVDRGSGKLWVRPDRAICADEDMGEYLFFHNQFIQTSTIVLPAGTARATLFDQSLRKGEDPDLCIRLHAAGVRFRMWPEPLSTWYDDTEVGRASRLTGYNDLSAWLERSRPLLTDRGVVGYQVSMLGYLEARSRPARVAGYLLRGLRTGMPVSVVARQALRSFLPRRLYRSLVDTFVRIRGQVLVASD